MGPRQSGKTTLAKSCFPDHDYISLESLDHRARASEDPRFFLKSLTKSTILDEVQNTPDLFSYLQEIIDDKEDHRQFILTGSNSFSLNEKISQSLAGRIRIFNILPLVLSELPQDHQPDTLDSLLLMGLYPRIYDEKLNPYEWFESYYQTYLQKDIKTLINVSDSLQFDRFVRLCAGRVGQLGDYSSIATEAGITHPTATRWSSVLESSFLTFRLPPHFKNFNKRVIKTPKMYFYDTGLLCQLLKVTTHEQLMVHPLRGEIFENYVVAEVRKHYFNYGIEPPLYFWRDAHGHEVDLIIDKGNHLIPIEIKSGQTFQTSWLKTLNWFSKLQSDIPSYVIYGGDDEFKIKSSTVYNWSSIAKFCESEIKTVCQYLKSDRPKRI